MNNNTPTEHRLPMSFNEARDAIADLIDKEFKTDRERVFFLKGLRLGIISGRPLQDEAEVKTFISAINLHLALYEVKK